MEAVALACCVKWARGQGWASTILRRVGFRDCGMTPDPEPLTVGFLGTGVCSHKLSATFLQVLYRGSMAATSHEAGLPCHDFASFLLWLSGALSPAGLPPPQVPTMLPNPGL